MAPEHKPEPTSRALLIWTLAFVACSAAAGWIVGSALAPLFGGAS